VIDVRLIIIIRLGIDYIDNQDEWPLTKERFQ
jgi:hypothetical protein